MGNAESRYNITEQDLSYNQKGYREDLEQKYNFKTGDSKEKSTLVFEMQKKGEMTPEIAKTYFESQFEPYEFTGKEKPPLSEIEKVEYGNPGDYEPTEEELSEQKDKAANTMAYRGNLHILGNYLLHVPKEEWDQAKIDNARVFLATKSDQLINERLEGNNVIPRLENQSKNIRDLIEELQKRNPAITAVLKNLWTGIRKLDPTDGQLSDRYGRTNQNLYFDAQRSLYHNIVQVMNKGDDWRQFLDYLTAEQWHHAKELDEYKPDELNKEYEQWKKIKAGLK